jgi:hypothetical protein
MSVPPEEISGPTEAVTTRVLNDGACPCRADNPLNDPSFWTYCAHRRRVWLVLFHVQYLYDVTTAARWYGR